MRLLQTLEDMRAFSQKSRSLNRTIGFVPTMGNLHQGHITLVERAQEYTDITVVSIFVNPMQFGIQEDIQNYPRTFEQDIEKLQKLNVDGVFFPDIDALYPKDIELHTQIKVPGISEILCGHYRPNHFVGVATVVAKLFNIVKPSIAVFGKKDYQQFVIINKMVFDLCMPIKLEGVDTVREADGLAMSSRNQYLSLTERPKAAYMYRTLTQIKKRILDGESDFKKLEKHGFNILLKNGFRPDYFSICDASLEAPTQDSSTLVILSAAWLGNARLIDNILCEI